eukprot:symbB.v1.2.026856.t1/scaffold2714.1/size94327/9
MPTVEEASTASGIGADSSVPNNLAILVPTFDPAVDNVEIWGKKVELLLSSWPPSKINELATRLILGCRGTAFQKLQLHSAQLLTGDSKGIKKIVELVGGTWGAIPLEQRFEIVERALFRNVQKPDETSDSYLSRSDVTWTELLNKNIQLDEIRSYILLRGSKLAGEDKKRVLVESGAEIGSALDLQKVTRAIRMLGSNFFQDMTGLKREKGLKTYDHMTLAMDEGSDGEAEAYWMAEDTMVDDQALEVLASEDDEDATLILQFEDAVSELVQNDQELGALFSTYQDARKRLSEKVRFRGFWSVKKGDRSSKGGKGKGKGKMQRQSLASRIASSYCRLCQKKGHWKNECPMRSSAPSTTTSSMSAPTTFVTAELNLPFAEDHGGRGEEIILTSLGIDHRMKKPCRRTARDRLIQTLQKKGIFVKSNPITANMPDRTPPISESPCKMPDAVDSYQDDFQESLFASSGTQGVVDLGQLVVLRSVRFMQQNSTIKKPENRVDRPSPVIMSVSQKLSAYRNSSNKVTAAERITAIKQMDLSALEKETVEFGKAHRGQSFPQAFEDHGWTDWFVKTYEWSGKESHVKFLTYVEKRLDSEISQGSAPVQVLAPKAKTTAKKSAAKPKSMAQGSEMGWSHVTEDVIETDSDEDLMSHTQIRVHEMEEQVKMVSQENSHMMQRMNGIEMALQELIHHVKGLGIKQEQ